MQLIAEHTVQITHPEKVLWPEVGVTKADLLQYLVDLSPHLLRHLAGRPLTTIRCPDGVAGHRFYQKDAPRPTPEWVLTRSVPSQERNKVLDMVMVDSVSTLLWLGNLGCLEFHTGFDPIDHPGQPDWVAIDLDPTVPGFEPVRTVAMEIHRLLEHLCIPHIAKTSGATGLQIWIPVRPSIRYEETRVFTQAVAAYAVAKLPAVATVERLTKNRGDKVYVDYLQHGPGRTMIAPYSPRATALATVSTPMTADELGGVARPESFTLQTVPTRVARMGDLLAQLEPIDLRPFTTFLARHGGFR
ncbi:MAG: non-homologous end-joining DNA ligase [Alicyclobacillus sp.]|nr:non-homologous end-joining DNA ligase [Alicyclobacillus sp.]